MFLLQAMNTPQSTVSVKKTAETLPLLSGGGVSPEMMAENTALYVGMVLLIVSLFAYVLRAGLWPKNRALHLTGWGAMALSLVGLTVALIYRSISAEYFALSNMFESLLVLTMGVQLTFLVLDLKFQQPGLGWLSALMCFVGLSFAMTLPREIMPLQAALVSYWRSIHVPVILLSYALFTVSFLAALGYLVSEALQSGKAGRKNTDGSSNDSMSPLPSSERLVTPEGMILSNQVHVSEPVLPVRSVLQAGSSPSAASLVLPDAVSTSGVVDREQNPYAEITYRTISLGIPLLTIGIILGGLWANEAWGNYWSWDPKESMSLVTLLGYGVFLHMRVNGGYSFKTLSWVAIAAYGLMLLTYFGVNMMGVGLHSYGKIG